MFWKYLYYRRWQVGIIIIFSILESLLSIYFIDYINETLLQLKEVSMYYLLKFVFLLVILFLVSLATSLFLIYFGKVLVTNIRQKMVQQIIDSDYLQIKRQTRARLTFSLNSDVESYARLFFSLPHILHGITLGLFAIGYMYYLHFDLAVAVTIYFLLVILILQYLLVIFYKNAAKARDSRDIINKNYAQAIDGQRELKKSKLRKLLYLANFRKNIQRYLYLSADAEAFEAILMLFFDIALLGLIGLVFYLSMVFAFADLAAATSFAVVILFMRSHLTSAIEGVSKFAYVKIGAKRIAMLDLKPYSGEQETNQPHLSAFDHTWQKITLAHVSFSYPQQRGTLKPQEFKLSDVDLSIKRGETIFIVGANAAGKSTLALLLAGIIVPEQGRILVDKEPITSTLLPSYQQLSSSVFSDFYLFPQIPVAQTQEKAQEIDYWLRRLEMDSVVQVNNFIFSSTNLSVSQNKRLALLSAIVEGKSLLILDEWAAEQDPEFRKKFYQEIIPELKAKGITIVAVTHDELYLAQADRVIFLEKGKVYESNAKEVS
ncbi:cyclic peptide export ABC transporter [Psittacicella gerlachiana]|uniref:ATP-binding cassette transporter n=1 Tax=Psittacicella gerlachiana TaxID=2028574 RepID=A0A3A1YKL4_9GAMM|nr:cyclic peptide export ABC transporter [Psittacicella gerlachiana]RIY36784.1 hypothetical protein CKF59_02265 [Psittacicella gerlachiana]